MNLYGFEKQANDESEAAEGSVFDAAKIRNAQLKYSPTFTDGKFSTALDKVKNGEFVPLPQGKEESFEYVNNLLGLDVEREKGWADSAKEMVMNNKTLSAAIVATGLGAMGYGIYKALDNRGGKKKKKNR